MNRPEKKKVFEMAKETAINITMEMDIRIPTVPNYILSADGKYKWELHRFNPDELEAIADAWKKELLRKASVIE